MSKTITGGCLCGKVRYTFSAKPVFSGNCHCRDCQKASGSAYTPAMFVAEDAVAISGEVKYFESKADSGRAIWRGFCPNCGSQLFSKLALLPGVIGVRAGTFDNTADFEPKMDIYTDSAAHWDTMNADLPKFAKAPTAG
jgi:hypothetical protein